jgi:hypothetical protein
MTTFTSSTFGNYMRKWLVAIGALELVIGAGFVVGAILLPEVRSGFILTSGILGLVGVALVVFGLRAGARAEEAERIDRTGLSGQGTITGVTQTGMSLNDNPQVEMELLVQIPGRAPYQATRKEFVPLILLGRVAPGAILPVKADPSDPSKVIVDWDQPGPAMPAAWGGATPGAAAPGETLREVQEALRSSGLQAEGPFAQPEQGQYTVEQLRDFLRVNGVSATATIDRIEDSGKTVGDERLFTMQVTVNVPGRPPHQGQPSAALVPAHAVGKLMVGRAVPVKVAADNSNMLMFEWDKL